VHVTCSRTSPGKTVAIKKMNATALQKSDIIAFKKEAQLVRVPGCMCVHARVTAYVCARR
jgi:hypothetical protein